MSNKEISIEEENKAVDIKKECEIAYGCIKIAQEQLEHLRSICKHENTFEGNYSWRIGVIMPATICSDCGKMIKYT